MGPDPHHHRPGRGHWHGPRPRGIPAKRARPIRRGRGRAGTPRTRETSDSPHVRGQRGIPISVPDARIPQGQATGMGRGGVPMKITPLAADSLGARSMATLVETPDVTRSEEHTSELQSLTNLVCRLLLEKKKKKQEIMAPRNMYR